MSQVDLQLHVGDNIQIQFIGDEHERRHSCQVVGFQPQASLIVTIPMVNGKIMLVREGQSMIVRLLSGNHVCAFTSRILTQQLKPYPYMHLEYPKELESIVVRKSLRTDTELVVSVFPPGANRRDLSQALPGAITNISTSGALLKLKDKLGEVGEEIYLSTRLTIGGIKEYLHTAAIIRNQRMGAKKEDASLVYSYGVEFTEVRKESVIALHGYVYEQLINSLG